MQNQPRSGLVREQAETLISGSVGGISTPDENASGLLQGPVDPLRYEVDRPLDPDEVPGIVAKMIPAGSRVLDVGCGEGMLSAVLEVACRAEFVGIEPDPTRAARAAARGLNVVVGFSRNRLFDNSASST